MESASRSHDPASGRDLAAILELLLGAGFLVAGMWISARGLLDSLSFYDEGILLSGANSILLGAIPHRDFYANYPPGMFLIIAVLWKVTGPSVMSVRMLGLLLHPAAGVFSGLIAGRCLGKPFSWLACGLVVFWLSDLLISPWPWLGGIVTALLFIWLLLIALSEQRKYAWVAAGLAWGSLLCIRHDLFVYLSLGVAVLTAIWAVRDRAGFLDWIDSRRLALFFAAGSLPILLVWVPVLVRSGVGLVVRDLFLDQVKYVLPARTLPLPPLVKISDGPWNLPLPAFLVARNAGAWVLLLLAPPATLAVLFWGKGFLSPAPVALMLVFSLAVLPQALGRSDQAHTIGSLAPALILLSALGARMAFRGHSPGGKVAWIMATALLLALPMIKDYHLEHFPDVNLDWRSRDGGLPWSGQVDPGHGEALSFIAENSSPKEAIFVGTFLHRWAFINAANLYFLANRRGATRYLQFDPNLVNRLEVQAEMISELEKQHTRVAVLTACCPISGEANASMIPGSDLLDQYLATRYRLVKQIGAYRLLLRLGDQGN